MLVVPQRRHQHPVDQPRVDNYVLSDLALTTLADRPACKCRELTAAVRSASRNTQSTTRADPPSPSVRWSSGTARRGTKPSIRRLFCRPRSGAGSGFSPDPPPLPLSNGSTNVYSDSLIFLLRP